MVFHYHSKRLLHCQRFNLLGALDEEEVDEAGVDEEKVGVEEGEVLSGPPAQVEEAVEEVVEEVVEDSDGGGEKLPLNH